MMSSAWRGGSTRQWRRIRTAILIRDHGQCQLRYPGCTTIATQVHHIVGKAAGDNPTHLIATCAHCNQQAGDPTTTDPPPQPRTQW